LVGQKKKSHRKANYESGKRNNQDEGWGYAAFHLKKKRSCEITGS